MISVIVPVWNAEKYLTYTIESVKKQTYNNWELLLIDDGSEDKSYEICERYKKEDNRIRVFSKKNGGVSSTRNMGLEMAKGEWVYFLDSDDWLEPECFEEALKIANDNQCEIVCWNFYSNTSEMQKKESPICPDVLMISNPDNIVKATMFPQYYEKVNKCFLGPIRSLCSKLVKRSLLVSNNLLFDETLKIGEDALFCAQCFAKAEKVIMVNKYWYHYRENVLSANRRYRGDVFDVYQNAMKSFCAYMGKHLEEVGYATSYKGMIWSYVNRILDKNIVHADNPYGVKKRVKDLKDFLMLDAVKKAFEIKTDDRVFRIDQKIMLYFIRHERAEMLVLFQKIKNVARIVLR